MQEKGSQNYKGGEVRWDRNMGQKEERGDWKRRKERKNTKFGWLVAV